MSLIFYLLFLMGIRGTKILGTRRWVQDFLARLQGWKVSPKIFRELLEERICFGSRVWVWVIFAVRG